MTKKTSKRKILSILSSTIKIWAVGILGIVYGVSFYEHEFKSIIILGVLLIFQSLIITRELDELTEFKYQFPDEYNKWKYRFGDKK